MRITFDRYHRLVPDIFAAFALTDAAGNELLCLCDDHRKTIPLSVEDKTAYEAGNNHEHLLEDILDEAFSELVADAPVLCRLIYCCLLYTSPSPRDVEEARMPSSA